MNQTWTIVITLLLVLTIAGSAGAVSSPSGIDPRLRLEYDIVEDKGGRISVRGYVYNDYARAAHQVRLMVESVDGAGQVLGRAVGFVFGLVPVQNRTYFDVRVTVPGTSYRVTVTSFDWRDGG